MTVPSERSTRRRFVATVGGGAVALLGGCIGTSDTPTYEGGEVNTSDINESNRAPRSSEELIAAEALAETETNESARPLDSLELEQHEFVVKSGYKGPMVQGIVANTGGERIRFAEVRVRVYNATGNQLGRYLDSTGDIGNKATWRFTAVLLESVADIADYDIAVLGVPK